VPKHYSWILILRWLVVHGLGERFARVICDDVRGLNAALSEFMMREAIVNHPFVVAAEPEWMGAPDPMHRAGSLKSGLRAPIR
jgi:hypothetical protein